MPKKASADAMKLAVIRGVPAPKFARAKPGAAALVSELAEGFVRSMLQRTACRRCTAKDALAMPFLDPSVLEAHSFVFVRA